MDLCARFIFLRQIHVSLCNDFSDFDYYYFFSVAVLSLTSCRWRSVRFGPPCSVTCALVDPYSHIRPVCPPAARRTLRRCLLGSVLGRHLHHRPGRLRSGAGRRDQSRQGGVSIQPGNPLLQGDLHSQERGGAGILETVTVRGMLLLAVPTL